MAIATDEQKSEDTRVQALDDLELVCSLLLYILYARI